MLNNLLLSYVKHYSDAQSETIALESAEVLTFSPSSDTGGPAG